MMGKVMIVDDSLLVRRQVGAAVTGAGFGVVEACDGLDALDKLDPSLSLIVCDVNMPRMGGLELLERIHADPSLANVPIVMLTTEANSELFARARSLGAKAWMLKPFKPELLVAAVRKLSARAA